MTAADQPPPCAGGTSVPFSRAEGLESLGQFRSVEIQASASVVPTRNQTADVKAERRFTSCRVPE